MTWLLNVAMLDMILLLVQEKHVFINKLGIAVEGDFPLSFLLPHKKASLSLFDSQFHMSYLKGALISAANTLSRPAASLVWFVAW